MKRGMMDNSYDCRNIARTRIIKLNWNEPRCYAPKIDPTRANQAYGKWALPKLAQELCELDQKIVRQAVTSIADISVNPEEMAQIIKLRIPERLADLLISEDPYLRERVAMIYCTMSRQAIGREAIFEYPKILNYLSAGLNDNLSIVRMKMAQVIENLARNPIAAEDLWESGFLVRLIEVIDSEKNMIILALHLQSLGSLLNNVKVNVNIRAIELNVMEKLVSLLNIKNKDETVVVATLDCLVRLCQEAIGKEKSIEMDLLSIMKKFLDDQRLLVYKKAAAVIVFMTITTGGKMRAFELGMIDRLVKLATYTNDRELQIVSIQALSNIAEFPDGKRTLLSEHFNSIENIDTCMDDTTEKYKNILLNIINSPS